MSIATVYSTGTISVTSGATAVTGTGTNFVAAGVRAGDWLKQKNGTARARIASVGSATALTLDENWPGSTLSGAAYYIEFAAAEERATGMLANVSAWIGSGGAQALAGITAAADKLFYLTGATTGAVIDFKTWARSFLGAADVGAARTALDLDDNYAALNGSSSQAFAASTINASGTITSQQVFASTSLATIVGPSGTSGVGVFLRPVGTGLTTGQLVVGPTAMTRDGYNVRDINNTPNGSLALAQAGTDTTSRTWSADHLDGIRRLRSYTKTTLPSASGLGAGHQIYVTNDVGGAIPAFSDGTSWRRVSDRAVIA